MKWWRVLLGLIIISSTILMVFNFKTGSQPEEQFIFNLSPFRFSIFIFLAILSVVLSAVFLQSFYMDNPLR